MSGLPVLDWLLRLLWGKGGDLVAFPVFPWLTYPLLGMAFGHWLVSAEHRDRFFKRSTWTGLALLLLGTLVSLTDLDFHIGDYWRSGPGALLWISGFVLLWLFLCHQLVGRLPSNPFFDLLYYWSVHVTAFYCIHWLVLGWAFFFFAFESQGFLMVILLMFGVAWLAHQGTRAWAHLSSRIPDLVRQ
jgi:hypothetical protein